MARKKATAKKVAKKKATKKTTAKKAPAKKAPAKKKPAKKKTPKIELTIVLDTVNPYHLSSSFWYFLPFPKNKTEISVLNTADEAAIFSAGEKGRVKWGWAAKRKDVKKPLTWKDWDSFFRTAVGTEASLLIEKSREREKHFSVRVAISEIKAASKGSGKSESFKIGDVKIHVVFSKVWLSKQ